MQLVMAAYPTPTQFRSSSPADLGMVILRGIIALEAQLRSIGRQTPWNPMPNLVGDVVSNVDDTFDGRRTACEGIAWLLSHDLIVEVHEIGANLNGTIVPTRLGREVAKIAEKGSAVGTALRAVDLIPIKMRTKVLTSLASGDFDMAIIAACKEVEITMRDRARLSTSDFGSRLAKKFFERVTGTRLQRHDRRGQLADEEHIFQGLFGLYRDRAAHEVPHVDSVEHALEIIIAVAHLLRIVEAADISTNTVGT